MKTPNQGITLENLAELLGHCLNEGCNLRVIASANKSEFTLEEVEKITLDAYVLGLYDVLDFIHGRPTAFVEMRSLQGRALAINPDKKITVMGVSQEAIKT